MQPHLDEQFLNRVRRAYHSAITVSGDAGQVWAPIDSRRNDVHSALLHHQNDALRAIFADPTATDLYYGCDNLCRSITQVEPTLFVEAALASGRGRDAARRAEQMAALLAKGSVSSVVEIGPGMGRAAFFAYRLGIIDYSTIDLPLGIAAQACFLARALGPDKLWFDGEASELATGKVKLFCAGKLPSGRYGVALNVDSMTEMPWHVAFGYVRWLGQHADLFLSVNHARNRFTVAELMAFAGMKCQARSAPFNPEGYVPGCFYREELYALRPIRAASVRSGAFSLFLKGRRLYAAARRRVSIAAKYCRWLGRALRRTRSRNSLSRCLRAVHGDVVKCHQRFRCRLLQ